MWQNGELFRANGYRSEKFDNFFSSVSKVIIKDEKSECLSSLIPNLKKYS